jgi:tetratricopeptide (TPR) repeat protein
MSFSSLPEHFTKTSTTLPPQPSASAHTLLLCVTLQQDRYYCACVKLNPKDARGIAAYAGMLHLHLHDDALAERYYREAMKLDLRSSNIIIEYANFLNTSGNPGKAEHYFAMACKVAPFDPNAQLAFALYLKEMKKYDRARGAFEKVTTNIVVFCLDHTYPILHSGHVVRNFSSKCVS